MASDSENEQQPQLRADVKSVAERYLERTLSKDNIDRLVSRFVRFALFMQRKKHPIKRDEVKKKVLQEHSKAFGAIYERAQVVLKHTFGLEMAAAGGKAAKASDKEFILRSTLPSVETAKVVEWKEEAPEMGFVCFVLSLIHVSGQKLTDELLFRHLAKLGVDRHQTHRTFGNMKEWIAGLIKHGYLDKIKGASDNQDSIRYVWGPRAKLELSTDDITNYMVQCFPGASAASVKSAIQMASA
ncbi:Melanoma-associated antigen D2 [Blyttiomyces sp. JEL0837]|nr:Melanoma-associated antigen D2 [Blyttiomyces sp. JEL0837]